MLATLIIGGMGTTLGPVLGASILVILPEALRFIALPDAQAASSPHEIAQPHGVPVLLRADGISKAFKGVQVLEDVTVTR